MSTYNAGSQIIDDGLIFYLDMSNPDCYQSGSSSVYDLINPDNTGSLKNSPSHSFDYGGGVQFIFGVVGGNSILMQDTQTLYSGSAWTFEYIARPERVRESTGAGTQLFMFQFGSGDFIEFEDSNRIFGRGSNNNVLFIFPTTPTLTKDEVNYISFAYDGTDLYMRINDADLSLTGSFLNSYNIRFNEIGQTQNNDDGFTFFSMRLWDRFLSESERTRNYNSFKQKYKL